MYTYYVDENNVGHRDVVGTIPSNWKVIQDSNLYLKPMYDGSTLYEGATTEELQSYIESHWKGVETDINKDTANAFMEYTEGSIVDTASLFILVVHLVKALLSKELFPEIARYTEESSKTGKSVATIDSEVLANFKQLNELYDKFEALRVYYTDILQNRVYGTDLNIEIPFIDSTYDDFDTELQSLLASLG